MQSKPLLPGSPGKRRASARMVAAGVATLAAVAAVGAVAVIVNGGGPVSLMGIKLRPVKGMVPMEAVGRARGEDPVYYVPMKQVRAANANALQQMAVKGPAEPVVYYYLPDKQAAVHTVHHQMLDDNATAAGGGGGASDKLVCTVDNIKALSAEVQGKWDACKAHKDYKEPNKGAARRLLGWVWEPESPAEKKTRAPQHGPAYYKLKLSETSRRFAHHTQLAGSKPVQLAQQMLNETAGNGTAAAGGGEPSFNDCQKKAVEKACAAIAGCADPVCDSYYNEPEIEALCGMCTMAPVGCFAHSAEVFSFLFFFVAAPLSFVFVWQSFWQLVLVRNFPGSSGSVGILENSRTLCLAQ